MEKEEAKDKRKLLAEVLRKITTGGFCYGQQQC